MSDTQTTVRPVIGTDSNDGGWTPIVAASIAAALSDDDVTTYAQNTASLVGRTGTLATNITSFVLADTDQVKYIRVWLTMVITTVGDEANVTVRVYSPDGSKRLPDQIINVVYPGAGRYDLLPYAGWPDGSAFTADDLDGLVLRFFAESVGATDIQHLRVREAGIDVVYNRAPTVTVAGLASEPFTNYSNPEHTFTFSDPESELQERYEDRIYQQPVAGWPSGATDDDVIAALEAAGEVPIFSEERLTDLTTTTRFTLPPTGLFRRYIRAADEGSGQRYGSWDVNAFTMNVGAGARPKLPTVAAGEDTDNARISLVIGTTGSGQTPDSIDVQRSDDGGFTWATCIESPVGYAGATTLFHDRFPPREQALIYRARTTRVQNSTTNDITSSLWASSAVITLTSDGNSWLQSPDDDTLDLAFTQLGSVFDLESGENQSVFYAEGRPEPIVFGGTIQLRRSTLVLVLTTDEQWETFQALRALRGKLLLRTLYGEGPLVDVWVKLGGTAGESLIGGYRITERGQLRQVTCPVFEVSAPVAAV